VTAGTPTVLAEDHVAFTLGREALVTVDCVGTLLRAFVDGMPVFAATHPTLPFGGIGLYTSANPGGVFAEVRVASLRLALVLRVRGRGSLPGWHTDPARGGECCFGTSCKRTGVISRALAFDGERGPRPVPGGVGRPARDRVAERSRAHAAHPPASGVRASRSARSPQRRRHGAGAHRGCGSDDRRW